MSKTKDQETDDRHAAELAIDADDVSFSSEFAQLLGAPVDEHFSGTGRDRISGVVVGTLVGFADGSATPLVSYRDQPGTAALPARSTLDLQGGDIGRSAVLMFEEGDPCRPIIVGCLHEAGAKRLPSVPGQVEIEADGERLLVSAKDRVVLRCGKASLTLTKEGKVIIKGAYVSNQSSGVLRLQGGSVQIN